MLFFTGQLGDKYYQAESISAALLVKHFKLPIRVGQPTTFIRTEGSITRPDEKGLNLNATCRVSGYYDGESYEVIYAINRTAKGQGDPVYSPTRLPLGSASAFVVPPQDIEQAVILCLNDKCADSPSETKGSDPRITVFQQDVIAKKRSQAAQDRTSVIVRITGASREVLANTHAYFAYKGEFGYSEDTNTHMADLTEKAFTDHNALAAVLDSDNFEEKSIISKALLSNKIQVGNKQGGRCATFVDRNHDLYIAPVGEEVGCILSALQATENELAKFLFASISNIVKEKKKAPVINEDNADSDEYLAYFDLGVLIVKDGTLSALKEDGTYKSIKQYSKEEAAEPDFLRTAFNFANTHRGYSVMIRNAFEKKANK